MRQSRSGELGRIRAPRSGAESPDELPNMSERRLLVVDDEADFAEIVRKVAERRDYRVEVLTESPEFAAAYAGFQPSVIVLDIVMPEVDGVEIVQWLAANGNQAPVILTSGYNPNFAKAALDDAVAG